MRGLEPADFALPVFGISLALIFALPLIAYLLEGAAK